MRLERFTSKRTFTGTTRSDRLSRRHRRRSMKRREFIVSSFGTVSVGTAHLLGQSTTSSTAAKRKILIAGGGFNTAFIRYMATLTGKKRPRICYLPTASADSPSGIITWFRNCAPLDVEPFVQGRFIASSRQTQSWDEALLSMDALF